MKIWEGSDNIPVRFSDHNMENGLAASSREIGRPTGKTVAITQVHFKWKCTEHQL